MKKRIFVLFTVILLIGALLLIVGCKGGDGESTGSNSSSDGTIGSISGGDGQLQEHVHTYATEWSSDKQYHWHNATCGHDAVAYKAPHSFGAGNKCGVCNYYSTGGFVFSLSEGGTSYSVKGLEEGNNSVNIVIPSEYNGLPVTAIDGNAFKDRSDLVGVTIPSSITSIGSFAFDGCDGLSRVDISDMSNWCKINFRGSGSNPVQFAKKLYLNNVLVTEVKLPNDVTNFDPYAFDGCSDITGISVDPDNAIYMSAGNCLIDKRSNKLVMGCSNSTIPAGVTAIGYAAFKGLKDLEEIVIPEGVTTVEEDAFRYCINLKSLELPASVRSIKRQAFSGCSALTDVIIPDGVTDIGAMAFAFCNQLTSVTIPCGVESVGKFAFVACRALTVYCREEEEAKPDTWDDNWNNGYPVVWDCDNNDVADDGNIYYVADNGLRYALKDGKATLVKQSDMIGGVKTIASTISYKTADYGVTDIAVGAFMNCSELTGIKIPATVSYIDYEAFGNCGNLTIYCEAASKPAGWNNWWNSSDRPVIWSSNIN